MCYKLDRSLWGVLVAVMLIAPPVQALSDDVAVQLLERLNDLEGEVDALRNENETLRDKLDGSPSREEDENQLKAEAEKASTADGVKLEEQAPLPSVLSVPAPQIPGVNVIVEDAAQAVAEQEKDDIPLLENVSPLTESATDTAKTEESLTESVEARVTQEKPTASESVTTTASTGSAAAEQNLAATAITTDAKPAESTPTIDAANRAEASVASSPERLTQGSTLSATSTQPTEIKATGEENKPATPVDPKSTESYYYYGTAEAEKKAEVTPAVASTTVAPPPATADQERKAKADYNQAYQLLVSKPAEAAPLFRSFLTNYPKHELAANAQYWLAEALYAQKDFQGASQEFMKVLKQYKDSPKSSGAALKLGYSFYELQQWEYARRTLEDTVRFFPDSSSAKLAELRLQKMKDEGH